MIHHAWVCLARFALAGVAVSLGCSASSPAHDPPVPPRPTASTTPAASVMAVSPPPNASASANTPAPPPTAEVDEPARAALPPGFIYVADPLDDHWKPSVPCGNFIIQNVKPANMTTTYEPYVIVTDNAGKKVYEAHGRLESFDGQKYRRSLVVDVCGDLTGDNIPEIILSERTMGAHCCYTYYVVSLANPSQRMLMWEKGDSGDGMIPIKLGKGPGYQLISYDRIFPPFDGSKGEPAVAYAFVPGYPILFEMVGSEYKARTFLFGDALRQMRDKEHAECKAKGNCEPNELYEWGLALIIGDWEQQKATIVPDAEDRKAFDRRSAQMRALMRSRLGP